VFSVVRFAPAGLLVAASIVAASVLAIAGCGDLDQASAAGTNRDDLVTEMAGQLSEASDLTYTATYQLAGGATAKVSQAQKPSRIAYAYPGGRLILTATATIRCTGDDSAPTCTETTPQPTTDEHDTGPMTSPDTVLGMLDTAAVDADADAVQHDTTIAGHHATCLDVDKVDGAPASTFAVCVTNEGVLGSFTANINGKPADVALTDYSDKVDESAFTLPGGATLTDKRK
jgi:hypothetical protein